MVRIIQIDKTVIDQINAGNAQLAKVIRNLPPRSAIWITHEIYAQLNEAEMRMVDDLGIVHPNTDEHYVNVYRIRGNATLRHTQAMDPGAFEGVTPEYEATVATAEAHRAELMTFDKKLSDTYRRVSGVSGATKIAPEMSRISAVSTPRNYNTGRQVLGLKQLNITPSGAVLPTPQRMTVKVDNKTIGTYDPNSGNIIRSDGPRTPGGARTTRNITAQVGEKIEPVVEHGPSASGDAKFQGATLAFQGANFVLQKINSAIEARRFENAWSKLQPEVQRRLDDDPQLGAMLFVYYKKGQGDAESAIDPVTVFESIQVGYGLNPDDALREYESRPRMTATTEAGDQIWLKPKAPMDIKRLKLPFGTTVAGLATFVPGKEKLVNVKFAGVSGFDDKLSSRATLDVPVGMMPRFYYLWPPDEISYYDGGRTRTVEVGWTTSDDSDWSVADIDFMRQFRKEIPVVKLDSWANPSTWIGDGALAAMVWPADNRTANLFQSARATQDNNNLLVGQGIGPMRWVRPEFVRVLKAPADD
jgi:hypothetical protein